MKLLTMTLAAAAFAGAAQADGGHRHGQDGRDLPGAAAASATALGSPASAKDATRTVAVAMRETEDGRMIFDPPRLEFLSGETVHLMIRNEGEQEHEFVMDSLAAIKEHQSMMAEMPDMAHHDANALHLQPGDRGEIAWTFGAPGSFEFACLLPGHYEGGMHGPLVVR